jgi:IS30 family transposase
MSDYAHLDLAQRHVVERMNTSGHTQIDIALAIGVDQSTISRWLRRLPGPYRAREAHSNATSLACVPVLVPLLERRSDLVRHLRGYLKQRFSIAQALIMTARKYPQLATISAQAAYDWLYSSNAPIKKAVRKLMVRPRSRRRPRKKAETNQGKITGMRPISQRPVGANDRTEFAHCEGDLIIGANGESAVATIVERVTRLTIIINVKSRKSLTVITALARRLREYHIKSITWDQGKELALHALLTKLLNVPVLFADAHSPWQRGSNENTNGVIRRHLPKGTSLDVHPSKLRAIQDRLNQRPMPVLSGAIPNDAYQAQLLNMH